MANFQAFFNFSEMRALANNFCLYHVNAPGQEEGAASLPEGFVYPTMEELSEQLSDVMVHFGLKTFIGIGVGVGANILVRFALAHPERVDALCLLNCVSTTAGWIEWGYQKLNARHLRSKGMTQGALDYLMWHHFGRVNQLSFSFSHPHFQFNSFFASGNPEFWCLVERRAESRFGARLPRVFRTPRQSE